MKTNKLAATTAAALFATATAATPLTNPSIEQDIEPLERYTILDQSFRGVGHGSTIDKNAEGNFSADLFYSYMRDNHTGQNILCSGLRVETPEGNNAEDIDIRTPSMTLWSLWRKVADDKENVVEYGSCITVQYGELHKQNIDFKFNGLGTSDNFLIFRQDQMPEIDEWAWQEKLLQEEYPEIWKKIQNGEDWTEDDRFTEFQEEAQNFSNQYNYALDQNVSDCENAGNHYDKAMAIWTGNHDGTELPICDRIYPAP